MNINSNIKITGFFQIIQSIFMVLIYNFLALAVFPPDTSTGRMIPDITYLLSSQIIGFLFTGFTLSIIFKVNSLTDYLIIDFKIRYILLTVGAFIAVSLLINSIDFLQNLLIPVYLMSAYLSAEASRMQSYENLVNMLYNIHPWMIYLIAAVLPAICEEFFFRGFLLQLSLKYYSVWTSILITSAIFAFVHFQFTVFLPLFVFGIFLGWLSLKTGRIVYSVILHLISNAVTLYLLNN